MPTVVADSRVSARCKLNWPNYIYLETGSTAETLALRLFKDSFGPVIALLNEHEVKYQMREVRSGVPLASPGVVEIVQAVGNAAMWGALATVFVAFINSRRGRKVIITLQDNTIVHAEGPSAKELERVLDKAKNLSAVDTGSKDSNSTD